MAAIQSGVLTRARQATPGFYRNNELLKTLGAFWAFALVHRRESIVIGGTYTFIGTAVAVTITELNIVSILKDANKAGVAYFIADANITTPMSETKQESIVLPAYAAAKSTSITLVKYDAVLRHAENEEFANKLRNNPEEDLWLFTNTGFIFLPFATIPLAYSSIGIERTSGDTTSAGGFKFSVAGKSYNGSPILQLGDTSDSKTFAEYTLTTGTLLNATQTGKSGDLTLIKRTTTATAVEIPLTNGGFATSWRLVNYATDADILGTVAVFDEINSKIVISATAPIGKLSIKAVAYNLVGVTGEKLFEVTLL